MPVIDAQNLAPWPLPFVRNDVDDLIYQRHSLHLDAYTSAAVFFALVVGEVANSSVRTGHTVEVVVADNHVSVLVFLTHQGKVRVLQKKRAFHDTDLIDLRAKNEHLHSSRDHASLNKLGEIIIANGLAQISVYAIFVARVGLVQQKLVFGACAAPFDVKAGHVVPCNQLQAVQSTLKSYACLRYCFEATLGHPPTKRAYLDTLYFHELLKPRAGGRVVTASIAIEAVCSHEFESRAGVLRNNDENFCGYRNGSQRAWRCSSHIGIRRKILQEYLQVALERCCIERTRTRHDKYNLAQFFVLKQVLL